MPNYAFKPMPEVPEDKIFIEYNFYQLRPETEIFAGITGLKFIRCNLTNCKIPVDAELVSCRHVQYNFCTNLRPDLVDRGLSPCEIECEHMVSKDVITIDGMVIDTVYEYADEKVIS